MEQQTTTAPVDAKVKLSPVIELIKKTLSIYKNGFARLVGMAFVPALGALPLAAIAGLYFVSISFLSGISQTVVNIALGILGVMAVVLMIVVYISAQAGMIFLIKNFEAGQKIKEAFLEGKKYAWEFFIVGLLTTVFVILWGLLLIIPGIIFAVYYSLSVYALINDDYKGRSALKRSKELIKGYWWSLAWRFIVLGIGFYLVSMFLSIPLFFVTEESLFAQIWSAILTLINLVIAPVSVIYSFLIYKNLAEIKGQKNA